LIDKGADVNVADQFHKTPLHLAAAHKFSAMTGVLLAAGAKVNLADDFGCTALHDAARSGAAENLALLLKAGASPAIADAFGVTPRQLARERGCDTIVAELPEPSEPAVRTASDRRASLK
jgi:ankyrin repeat protein